MAAPTLNPMQKVRRHKIQDIKKKLHNKSKIKE